MFIPPPLPQSMYTSSSSDYLPITVLPPPELAQSNKKTAKKIAELLAPISLSREVVKVPAVSPKKELTWAEERERLARNAMNKQYIEEEAIRRVREQNRRDDVLTQMELEAKRKVERRIEKSRERDRSIERWEKERSRERRERERERREREREREVLVVHAPPPPIMDDVARCDHCGEWGHEAWDCSPGVILEVGRNDRKGRYHEVPRLRVRYIDRM
jgi:hypothetical protein